MDDKEGGAQFADLQKEARSRATQATKTAARLKEIGVQFAAASKDADALEPATDAAEERDQRLLYRAEKALDAIGAKLTPHQKGKAMIAKLPKDKVL